MPQGMIEITDFSAGLNVRDSEYSILSSQSRVALNVNVGRGFVEKASGFDLWNHDITKTGGINMMFPYYKSDGTKQFIIANDNDYYYLEDDFTINQAWETIGEYGTVKSDNPRGAVYDDKCVLSVNNSIHYFGDATTRFDITAPAYNPDGDRIQYTHDGTGTAPSFSTYIQPGAYVTINSANFNSANNGTFATVTVGTGFIVIVNASGVLENDKTLGDDKAMYSKRAIALWNGTNFSQSLMPGSSILPPTEEVNIFEYLQGGDFAALFGVKEGTSTVFWCRNDDPTKWLGGTAGSIPVGKDDGEGIKALQAQGGTLWVIKETRKYPVQVIYDEVLLAWIPRVLNSTENSGGTIANDSCAVVVHDSGDDIHMLSRRDGVLSFGRHANFGDAPISFSVSELIKPLTDLINWKHAHKAKAIVWDRKYWLAVPTGGATTNNVLFVRDLYVGGWVVHSNVSAGAMAILKDEDGVDELYIADANEPKIYKMNKSRFDIDGVGYRSKYQTGKTSVTQQTGITDSLRWIDIGGAIREGSKTYIKVSMDGIDKLYLITSDNFITDATTGATIGTQIVGSEITGGATRSTRDLKFKAHIDISDIQREFTHIEISIYDTGEEIGYWKVDYLALDFYPQRDEYPRQDKYILTPIT